MADVYLARDVALDRQVALKVLFPEFAEDPSFVERFRREAKAAANLNHPNIVGIYDWGQEQGTYYIVMEYVEGSSIAEILSSDGRLDPDRAAEIASDVAAALASAHAAGIVHRDMKPGNVIISDEGKVKVADFGIATALARRPGDALTQVGSVMGTAAYFSPEQAQAKPLDGRSDLYSLGVVLYEMVVGTPPFAADTPTAVAVKHVQETPISPRGMGIDIAQSLNAITLKLLAKKPARRYPKAADLRADLKRYLAGARSLPPLAGPVSSASGPAAAMGARTPPGSGPHGVGGPARSGPPPSPRPPTQPRGSPQPGPTKPPRSPKQPGPTKPPRSPKQAGPTKPPRSPKQAGPTQPPRPPQQPGPTTPPRTPQAGPTTPPRTPQAGSPQPPRAPQQPGPTKPPRAPQKPKPSRAQPAAAPVPRPPAAPRQAAPGPRQPPTPTPPATPGAPRKPTPTAAAPGAHAGPRQAGQPPKGHYRTQAVNLAQPPAKKSPGTGAAPRRPGQPPKGHYRTQAVNLAHSPAAGRRPAPVQPGHPDQYGPPAYYYEAVHRSDTWKRTALMLVGLAGLVAILIFLVARFYEQLGLGGGDSVTEVADTTEATLVVVPDLYGLGTIEAEARLRQLGVGVTFDYVVHATAEQDTVFAQMPASGQRIEAGKVVELTVAQREVPKVPPITGRNSADARGILEENGYVVIRLEETNQAEAGIVVRQEPASNSELLPGEAVKIVVSTGPGQIFVPDVRGNTTIEAFRTLNGLGFDVDERFEASETILDGAVIDTEPPVRTPVNPQSRIVVIISSGPPVAIVPDVQGLLFDTGRLTLEREGLVLGRVSFSPVESGSPDRGRILSQTPAPNDETQRGTLVDVVVGQIAEPEVTTTTTASPGETGDDSDDGDDGGGGESGDTQG